MMLCWGLVLLLLFGLSLGNIVVMSPHNVTRRTIPSFEAAFGPQLGRHARMRGYMVVANPPDACGNISAPPRYAPTNLKWMVLISRSRDKRCTFDLKVLHAQLAGYEAAVVHNMPGDDDIFVMHADRYGDLVTIPSQFIGFSDSEILTEFMNGGYIFEMNGEQPTIPDPYFYIIPFFVVVCIIVIILVIALVVKLCREYFHSRRARLSKRNLKKLPTKKFVKNADPYETCAVCLDDFEDGDKIRILPCNHAYHCQCIDPWLLKRKRCCPVCKRKIHFGRRRDAPTAAPDSSDSETAAPGDERTPLLGAMGGPSASSPVPSTSAAAANGVINAGPAPAPATDSSDEEAAEALPLLVALVRRLRRRPRTETYDAGAALPAAGPALYGSFDPAPPRAPGDRIVEVHTPPAAAPGPAPSPEPSPEPEAPGESRSGPSPAQIV